MTTGDQTPSPMGSTIQESRQRRADGDPIYRAHWDAHAETRDIAWQIIKYRMDTGLTQQELAARVGTSHSQIARIESGRHTMTVETLRRIGDALGFRLVITFEPRARPTSAS